ncbi:MAG: flavodoxin [Prevotella sp.]|nr:flavodoxin [Prevotella sp.]MBQ9187055.1 flavodoxin [Prevotella sp.]
MKIAKWMMAVAALMVSVACSGNKKSDANADQLAAEGTQAVAAKTGSKALVVFFSHAGDNYSVGNIKVGNTKIVADYISEITGAEQFEIVTHKYDGMAYRPLCDLAKEEQQNGELPPFEGSVDVSKYDTVFVGGPVWWGTYPQVMFTFFQKYDLNDKTVIPFTTHEGSGLGSCVKDLKKAYPKANFLDAFSIYGHDVREGKGRVEKWLKKLGYGE